MNRIGFGMAVALCLGAWHASTALPAAAQPAATGPKSANTEQARKSFEAGVAAYEQGNYAAALEHFTTAMRLKPHPVLHVNIANCYDRQGQVMQALGHFRRFLSFDVGTPAQRTEVEAAIARLEATLGSLTVTSQPEGASVSVDGVVAGTSPLRKHPVTPGQHEVSLRLPGHEPVARTIEVRARGTATVAIHLSPTTEGEGAVASPSTAAVTPAPTVVTPAPAPTTTEPAAVTTATATGSELSVATNASDPGPATGAGLLHNRTARWGATGVAGGLLLGALLTGIVASSAEADFEDNRALAQDTKLNQRVRRNAWNLALGDAARADDFATASDIFLIGTAIVGGVAAYMWAVHWRSAEREHAVNTTLWLAPEPDGAGGAAGLSGRF